MKIHVTRFVGSIGAMVALAGCTHTPVPEARQDVGISVTLGAARKGTPSPANEQFEQAPEHTIRLHGTVGLRFTGTITADGRSHAVSGRLPSEFVVTGHLIECEFYKTEPAGVLALRIMSKTGDAFQETHTDRPTGGVRGAIKASNASVDVAGNQLESSSRESTVTIFEK